MSWLLTGTCPTPTQPQFTDKAGFRSCRSISKCHYLSNRGILCMGQYQQLHVPSITLSLSDRNGDDPERSHPTPDTSHTTQITLD